MTVTVANTANTNTVQFWRLRTNDLADAMTNKAVTVDSNTATGNASVNGYFASTVLVANTIRGGTTALSGNLSFSSNVNFAAKVGLGAGANVLITTGNSTHRVLLSNTSDYSVYGGKIAIASDLSDANVSAPANTHLFYYNSAEAAWKNISPLLITVNNSLFANLATTATTTLTANNTTYLNGQLSSYYTNASNMSTGTLPAARVTGAYGNITGLGTLTSLTVSGAVAVTGNVTVTGSANVSVNINVTGNVTASDVSANTLRIYDTDSSHYLTIDAGSNLTAARTLTITTGDAARTLDISAGSVTVSATAITLLDDASTTAMRTTLGLGTAAVLDTGTSANNVVKLDTSARLPAVDGSQLTNLPVTFTMPAGVVMPYAGASLPSGWLLCYGQAVNRTTYSALFTAISTTYGIGDGSTTFNLPDLRGRVVAGDDNMGGVSANRLTNQPGGLNGDTLGATGGSETHTLTEAELATHDHVVYFADTDSSGVAQAIVISGGSSEDINAATNDRIDTQVAGSNTPHNNIQPTIILNYIIKT